MANPEHVELIRKGAKRWNDWRHKNPQIRPDLSEAELAGADLSGADLSGSKLTAAVLSGADLSGSNLSTGIVDRGGSTRLNQDLISFFSSRSLIYPKRTSGVRTLPARTLPARTSAGSISTGQTSVGQTLGRLTD